MCVCGGGGGGGYFHTKRTGVLVVNSKKYQDPVCGRGLIFVPRRGNNSTATHQLTLSYNLIAIKTIASLTFYS